MENGFNVCSSRRPTYWPMDRNKTPDILDIAITNTNLHIKARKSFELHSEHTYNIPSNPLF
ncbi:hypothetical protein WH47_00831 [Habropoda laboriosa]|uniref:Uncharacterized protein n=1 Tax=Habropoda laboriosa TaxID=597456 RepID=A0A0L7QKB0_9HYME|nr:hypothetical protein WH47_00831 [Habropoda laboriosa]